MKTKRNLLIGILLGALIGWTLGFLRLPYLEKNASFLMGFLACFAVVSLAILLIFAWNKKPFLLRLIGENSSGNNSHSTPNKYAFIGNWVAAFVVAGALVSSVLISWENRQLSTNVQTQDATISQQAEVIASLRSNNLVPLMGTLLEEVKEELKNNSERILSDEIILKIAALGQSMQPYRYFEGDGLADKAYSPERGQLLVALVNMNIDSSSFNEIKRKTPFAGADLRKIDLNGANLAWANLKDANLRDANLGGANLNHSDLRAANLWGANLNKVNMREADLRRANLAWAELNEANLNESDMSGIDFTNAKLKKADLTNVNLRWSDMSGTFLNEANLNGAYLLATNLNKANMSDVELIKTGITGEAWFEKLDEWQVTGAKAIQKGYQVVDDPDFQTLHSLQKIDVE